MIIFIIFVLLLIVGTFISFVMVLIHLLFKKSASSDGIHRNIDPYKAPYIPPLTHKEIRGFSIDPVRSLHYGFQVTRRDPY